MRVRKSVKIWSKIAIMKLEAAVFGVMRAVTINCKLTLPGLITMLNKNTLGVKKVRGQSEAALQIGMCDQKL